MSRQWKLIWRLLKMYYPTTKGLTTGKLRYPRQKNPVVYLLFVIIILSVICLFYQNLIIDVADNNKIDMKYETADELYINAETKKTKELLRRELEKTKKKNEN